VLVAFFAGRYSSNMSEFTMGQLVNDFAGVLYAVTESEKVLLDRVRRVRLAQHDEGRVTSGSPFSSTAAPSASVIPPQPLPYDPPQYDPQQSSPNWSEVPVSALVSPDWRSQPPSAPPPHANAAPVYEPASAATESHRDYNYFAELDEKLTGLRERYLE
jgi:hypothetical protein